MAQPLDPNQYEEVPADAPSMGGSLAAPQAAAAQPLDASQFEELPSYANGASPLTPVNKSPIGPIDRAAMSMGNTAGNIKFLKSKFEDAVQEKDSGDLLVKDQGIWHRVDPKTLDMPDAWSATKNILKKLPSLAGDAIDVGGQIAGTALGATAGIPGMIAGSGAGMGAGEALRTSLGRLVGTYEATPEQQAKDIGLEGLLGLGGETVAAGVRPVMPMVKSAFKSIGENATNIAKENMSALWGGLTDAGRWATRRAMDSADSVIGKADIATKAIGNKAARADAIDYIADRQLGLVKDIATESKAALQRNYGQQLLQLVKDVPDSFSANVGDMMKEVQQNMVEKGYGKMVGKEGAQRFEVLSLDDIAKSQGINSEQVGKIFGDKSEAAMKNIAKITNKYGMLGEFEGKHGARQLVDLKKALGESFDDLFADDVPQSIQRAAAQIKDDMMERVGQKFADHDVGPQYMKMNADYSSKKDVVDMLSKMVDKGQSDAVVKHLVSKAGGYRTFKGEVATLADLLGEAGQKKMNDIADWEAAKGFTDIVPRVSGGNSFGTLTKTASTLTGQNIPRSVGKQIEYGSKALDFVKSLPPKQMKQFLGNDQAVTEFMKSAVGAYESEDQHTEQLLQSAGVK